MSKANSLSKIHNPDEEGIQFIQLKAKQPLTNFFTRKKESDRHDQESMNLNPFEPRVAVKTKLMDNYNQKSDKSRKYI